jgi:hypothetical protein
MCVKLPCAHINPVSTAKLLCPTTLATVATSLLVPTLKYPNRQPTLTTWLLLPHPSTHLMVSFFLLFSLSPFYHTDMFSMPHCCHRHAVHNNNMDQLGGV